jgi:DNA replication and repair protein RecF
VRISRLELTDFRNYTEWSLEPDAALTVLVGPNAIGKTNVIEAIQIVCTGTSFRKPEWQEIVRWGADTASVEASIEGEVRHDVALQIEAAGTRSWRVDGLNKRRTTDATRFTPVVAFTPDDLSLVKGPAEQRRSAIDGLGEQLSATYGALRRDYTRVIRQRNALLRDGGAPQDLHPWDAQLITLGARLHVHRQRLIDRVAEAMVPIYEHLSAGEDLSVSLSTKIDSDPGDRPDQHEVESALREALERRRADEWSRKASLVGPHRDDILFTLRGHDARAYASQGQQRTIALAWKWAEVAVVTEVAHKTPLLLLDDVMSELDVTRRGALTDLVQRDIQTFVTTTTTDYFDTSLLRSARVLSLGA